MNPMQQGMAASLSQGRPTPRQNAEGFLKRGFDWLGVPDSRGVAKRVMSYDPLTAAYDAAQETTRGAIQRNPYMAGSGVLAGLLSAVPFAKGAKAIRAYHGSPHDFDRFDASKIGTGEGAQAYGHGLYFAENPSVAQAYRDSLTLRHNPPDQQVRRFLTGADDNAAGELWPEGLDMAMLGRVGEERTGVSNAELVRRAQQNLASVANVKGPLAAPARQRAQATLDYLLRNPRARFVGSPYEGRMYEVDINASPEQFLDWDTPIKLQPLPVRDRLNDVYPDLRGDTVARAFPYGIRPQISDALNRGGIPGIKYLDQGSRVGGEGTRNYVVFNPGIVDIVRKYMTPLALGLGSAGVAYQAQQQRPMQ